MHPDDRDHSGPDRRALGGATGGGLQPEPQIDCIDCGGRCFLLSHPPEDGIWEPGDIVAYRCEDCRDRWDLVLPDETN